MLYVSLKHHRRNIQNVLLESLACPEYRLTTDARAPGSPGPATIRRRIRIPCHHAHGLKRHTDRCRRNLSDNRFGTLPLLRHADRTAYRPRWIKPDRAAVLGRDACSTYTVEHRRRVGQLDEGGKPDAAINSFFAQSRLLLPKRIVIHHAEQLIERLVMGQTFKDDAGWRRVGIRSIRDQITAPEFCRIHSDRTGRRIDKTLSGGYRDRMSDRAVLAHYVLVLKDDVCGAAVITVCIRAANQIHDLVGFDGRSSRINRIGADPRPVIDIDGKNLAVLRYSHAAPHAMIACVYIGNEGFRAYRRQI